MAGSFQTSFLASQPYSPALVRSVRLLGEHRGRELLYVQQSPQVLEVLRQSAIVASMESSNRIEGVIAPSARIAALAADRTQPRTRSEQEIAGYRDVLQTVHSSAAHIPLRPSVIQQLHRDLCKYTGQEGGHWKSSDNAIVEFHPDGTRIDRFTPVPAWRTATAMEELCDGFRAIRATEQYEPVLLIAAFVLDFLCIHPFADGNGRMSRLLTLLLLYHEGFEVGRFISLEMEIEQTKESYYAALHTASFGWHDGTHSLLPWWEYFLGVMLIRAYQDFEMRVGELTSRRGAKSEQVREAILRLPETFTVAEIMRLCPGVSRPTINRVLQDLQAQGMIECPFRGRGAHWRKSS